MNKPAIPPEAEAKAWDLTEVLIFERIRPPRCSAAATAAAIGVSEPTLKGWEEGHWLPGLGSFVAWADVLGYDVVLVPRGAE